MGIQETKLWELFKQKVKKNVALENAVLSYCDNAITLAGQIVRFFPNFTRHDGKHIIGVCEWMSELISSKKKTVTLNEAAFLLMASCSHDLGMLVEKEEETLLLQQAKEKKEPEWKRYFLRHPEDETRLDEQYVSIIQNFVRETHHIRAKQIIENNIVWPDLAELNLGITKEKLFEVCRSHDEDLSFIDGSTDDLDLNFCAVLLRLADALDYDAGRAPEVLYRFLGLDDPITPAEKRSDTEWQKNFSGKFKRANPSTFEYRATDISSPEIYQELSNYIGWLNKELPKCLSHLGTYSPRWGGDKNLIPAVIVPKMKTKGFQSADFKLRMDQSKVLELLSGDNLYDDSGVFVRELLQNSIDAVLTRRELDESFSTEDGEISVDVWADGCYMWFRIKDNGIGMDERIILNYLLNVGRSYYSDKEGLEKDLLRRNIKPNFKPISRFGIGILSCFMGGGNDNIIELSTKRFSLPGENENSPFRLDITGLDGLYFLTELSNSQKGKPMHGPKGLETEEYLREVGTTVCVRLNTLNTGTVSFKDRMDKYVHFPEVNIKYNGPEGPENYHTRTHLEELLNRMNPDFGSTDAPTEYQHEVPHEVFEKYKSSNSEYDWSNISAPIFTVKYWPLHKMSSRPDNLAGTIITVDQIVQEVPLLDGSRKFPLRIVLEDGFCLAIGDHREEPFSPSSLTQDEVELLSFGYIRYLLYSYCGIPVYLVPAYSSYGPAKGTILLSGDYRPIVSISRNRLLGLPLEAACEIAVLMRKTSRNSRNVCSEEEGASSADFIKLLESHSEWSSALSKEKAISSVPNDGLNSLFLRLWLALAKKGGSSITVEKKAEYSNETSFTLGSDADPDRYRDELQFPPSFFFANGSPDILCQYIDQIYLFSLDHHFIKWLVAQRERLQKEAPAIYKRIIRSLPYSPYLVNDEIAIMKQLPGDPCHAASLNYIKAEEIVRVDKLVLGSPGNP